MDPYGDALSKGQNVQGTHRIRSSKNFRSGAHWPLVGDEFDLALEISPIAYSRVLRLANFSWMGVISQYF